MKWMLPLILLSSVSFADEHDREVISEFWDKEIRYRLEVKERTAEIMRERYARRHAIRKSRLAVKRQLDDQRRVRRPASHSGHRNCVMQYFMRMHLEGARRAVRSIQ